MFLNWKILEYSGVPRYEFHNGRGKNSINVIGPKWGVLKFSIFLLIKSLGFEVDLESN